MVVEVVGVIVVLVVMDEPLSSSFATVGRYGGGGGGQRQRSCGDGRAPGPFHHRLRRLGAMVVEVVGGIIGLVVMDEPLSSSFATVGRYGGGGGGRRRHSCGDGRAPVVIVCDGWAL